MKKVDREKWRAAHAEKLAAFREKVMHDPEVDRKIKSIQETARQERKETKK